MTPKGKREPGCAVLVVVTAPLPPLTIGISQFTMAEFELGAADTLLLAGQVMNSFLGSTAVYPEQVLISVPSIGHGV